MSVVLVFVTNANVQSIGVPLFKKVLKASNGSAVSNVLTEISCYILLRHLMHQRLFAVLFTKCAQLGNQISRILVEILFDLSNFKSKLN